MLKITTQATVNITTIETVNSSETIPVTIAILIIVLVAIGVIIYFARRFIKKCSNKKYSSQKNDVEKSLIENNVTKDVPLNQLASVNEEPMIIPEKNTALQSGPREKPKRLQTPRKWFDSTALNYMDQSTENVAAI